MAEGGVGNMIDSVMWGGGYGGGRSLVALRVERSADERSLSVSSCSVSTRATPVNVQLLYKNEFGRPRRVDYCTWGS